MPIPSNSQDVISLNNRGAEWMLDGNLRAAAIRALGEALQLSRESLRWEERRGKQVHDRMKIDDPPRALEAGRSADLKIFPLARPGTPKNMRDMKNHHLVEEESENDVTAPHVVRAEGAQTQPNCPLHLFIFKQPLQFECDRRQSCSSLLVEPPELNATHQHSPPPPMNLISEETQTVVSSVIIFNLALANHLMALEEIYRCKTHNSTGADILRANARARALLEKASRLYRCTIDLFNTDDVMDMGPNMLQFVASINNLAQAYSMLGYTEESDNIFRHLLSILLFVVDSGCSEDFIANSEGFWKNVVRFAFPISQPAAAA